MIEQVRLKDVCSKIGSGSTPKGGASVYIDKGVSLIRSQNVYNLEFSYPGLAHINDEAAKKLKGVTIYQNDVLLNITGDSVARTCMVPDDVLPARVNQHVAIIRPDENIIRPHYLSYYLSSPFMQQYMLNLALGKGASRSAITKGMIERFTIPKLELSTQDKIIEILSVYDKAISNLDRQVALVEKMATELYKEWFVRMRFPGHEKVQFDKGIPTSWSVVKLGEVAAIKAGGDAPAKCSKEKNNEFNVPIFSNGIDNEGLYGYTDKASIFEKSVTVSARGTVGYAFLRTEPYLPIVRLISVIPSKEINLMYLYLMLDNNYIEGYGTSQQQITIPFFSRKKILLPEIELQNCFSDLVKPLFEKKENLKKQKDIIIRQRDMILPRLMSGKSIVN